MRLSLMLILMAAIISYRSYSQQLVASFNPPLPIRAAHIKAVKVQPDNKILVAGDIAFYGTKPVNNLIRLEPDGSLDATFNYSFDRRFLVISVELTESGEIILLAREFESYDMIYSDVIKLIRLNSDGSLKKEVNTIYHASSLAIQEDGKILVGGSALVRYHEDLTMDNAFNNQVDFSGGINAIAVTGENILVAGEFSVVNGETKNDIVRLHQDGSLDETFDTGLGTEDYVGALTVQADGKILLGECYINSFNGTYFSGMARLHSDGSIDHTFNPPHLNGGVTKPVVVGNYIYAGAFLEYGGQTKDRLFRLHVSNGNLDTSFEPLTLDDFGGWTLQIAAVNDDIIINNSQAHGNVFGLSKVNANGDYVTGFSPAISRYGTISIGDIFNGQLLVAGDFIRINGVETFGVARLNSNGSVDESFRLNENKGVVRQLEVLDDDNVLVSTSKHFFKLDASGNEKSEFSWSPFKDLHQVIKFAVLDDAKIMAADPNLIYRLNPDGTEDESFNVNGLCCWRSTLFDFDMQADNVIYGSAFSNLGGHAANRLARLKPDGSVDPEFDIGTGPDDIIGMVKVLDNGEIIVGGLFSSFDGKPLNNRLVKLSPNGALDSTFYANQLFAPSAPYDIIFSPKVEQIGSKIFFRGTYSLYVINIDGTVDTGFSIPASVSSISDIIGSDIIGTNSGISTGRTKETEQFLFAMGNFKVGEQTEFILKMQLNNSGTSPEPGEKPVEDSEDPDKDPVTAAEEGNQLHIDVFPQPVKDKLTIKVNNPGESLHVTIVDLSGRALKANLVKDNSNGTSQLDVSNFAPGFYVLKIQSRAGTKTVKFIKS